jgi:hypothetical protein
MPSFKKEEEAAEELFSHDDIVAYRAEIAKFQVKKMPTTTLTAFEQFVVKKGVAKFDEKWTLIVTDVSGFDKWVKVRNSVESTDAWKADELRRLFPAELAKYKARFAKLREAVRELGLIKRAV